MFWLNGGPGCSSLDGAFYEHGPFYFKEETIPYTPIVNPYAWNNAAHMIYLETPAGVGFSMKKDTIPMDDTTTGNDNVLALNMWLDRFGLRNNPVFITGESYAGVYVPYFSLAIDNYNNNPATTSFINF